MADFDTQQQLLADQLRRYQAQAQTQAPQGRQVGRVYVAPNPLEYLAAGLKAYGGMKGEQQTQQEIGELAKRRNEQMAAALQGFGRQMQGTPAVDVADGPGQTFTAPAQAGDPMGAYQQLMSSGIPELQKIGMQGVATTAQDVQKRQQLLQDQETERQRKLADQARIMGLLQSAKTPQEAIAAGVPAELVKTYYDTSLGKTKGVVINGQLVDPTNIGATVAPQAPAVNLRTDLLIPGPDGKLIPNQPLIDAKKGIASAGASRNSTTVINAGQKEFEKQLGELDAKQLAKYRDNAETAQSLLGTVANLREAEKMGAYSGGGADTRLAVSSMIEGWTGIAPKGLVGSQIYNAEANKLILDRVKALGANPSNADREFIQKTVPQLATSAEARKQMADWMERTAMKSIDLYQQADTYARTNKGLGGFNVITPAAPKPAGASMPKGFRVVP